MTDFYLPVTDRIELLMYAVACLESLDEKSHAKMRESIKEAVKDWPQDLIIETLLDAGAMTRHKLADHGLLLDTKKASS